jgi:uncharacterized protein (DUF362 family)
MRDHCSRRAFLKTAAGGALAATGAAHLAPRLPAQEATSPSVLAVAQGDDPAEITRRAIAAIGGIRAFVPEGSEVLIKANIGWARAPEYAANTNPDVVRALIEMCLQEAHAGSALVIDNTCNNPRQCYTLSGIGEAAQAAGAEVAFFRSGDCAPAAIGGQHLETWPVHARMGPAPNRVIINVPIAKHHGISNLTLGMKNFFGNLGGNRGQLHQSIHRVMPDITAHFAPALTVIDAYRILLRNGPQGGDLADVEVRNTVAATNDPVAADAYGTTLFGREPGDMQWIVNAHAMGLGEMSLDRVEIQSIAV